MGVKAKKPKLVQITECLYVTGNEDPYVEMGSFRTKCPRCGAQIRFSGTDEFHRLERREA